MEKSEILFLPRQLDEDIIVHENANKTEAFKKIIRKLGLKVTDQRVLILDVLHEGQRHATAQEIFEKVHKLNADVGFATVYRFLKSLTEGQFITETRIGTRSSRYELCSLNHHDHITCTSCGKICEFENRAIENLQLKVAHQFGFILTHHVLELYGQCLNCQNKPHD